MAIAQTKERMNRIITGTFFIFAATILKPVHIPPRPKTIMAIKGMELANTGGATESMTRFFWHIIMIMPKPTNRRPKELTGMNISSKATKSQMLAAYSSFHKALQNPPGTH